MFDKSVIWNGVSTLLKKLMLLNMKQAQKIISNMYVRFKRVTMKQTVLDLPPTLRNEHCF